ncbi:MAG: hypothetical protein Tsb005_01030 [Gammaproteobacteria bacterium]
MLTTQKQDQQALEGIEHLKSLDHEIKLLAQDINKFVHYDDGFFAPYNRLIQSFIRLPEQQSLRCQLEQFIASLEPPPYLVDAEKLFGNYASAPRLPLPRWSSFVDLTKSLPSFFSVSLTSFENDSSTLQPILKSEPASPKTPVQEQTATHRLQVVIAQIVTLLDCIQDKQHDFSEYNEIVDSLILIKNYCQNFLTELQKTTQLTDDAKRKIALNSLLERKPYILGFDITCGYLNRKSLQIILNSKKNKRGIHKVDVVGNTYWKLAPSRPGVQYTSTVLHRYFGGGSPASLPILLVAEGIKQQSEAESVQAPWRAHSELYLVSRAVKGKTFEDAFKENAGDLNDFDPYHFAYFTMVEQLILPADNSMHNLLMVHKLDEQTRDIKKVIICVDEDESGVINAFLRTTGYEKIHVAQKTATQFLPQMSQPLDTVFKQKMAHFTPLNLMISLKAYLRERARLYTKFILFGCSLEELEARFQLPLRFAPKLLGKIYNKTVLITQFCQQYLNDPTVTPGDLSTACDYELTRCYQQILNIQKNNIAAAYYALCEWPIKRIFEYDPLMRKRIASREAYCKEHDYDSERYLTLEQAFIKWMKTLDASQLSFVEQNLLLEQLLKLWRDTKTTKPLTLNGFTIDISSKLKPLLEGETNTLKIIKFKQCSAITFQLIKKIVDKFPGITIELENCSAIKLEHWDNLSQLNANIYLRLLKKIDGFVEINLSHLDTSPEKLQAVIALGNKAIVEFFVKKGADIHEVNKNNGDTVLHATACLPASKEANKLFNFFLDHLRSASCREIIFASNKNHQTVLHYLVKQQNKLLVSSLLDQNKSDWIIARDKIDGETCLHIAASTGNQEILKILLQALPRKQAELMVLDKDNNGADLLMRAACQPNAGIVTMLLEDWKVNVATRDHKKYWETPLHKAANLGYVDIVKVLLKYGAAVDAVNQDAKTPLEIACDKHCYEVVALLYEHSMRISALSTTKSQTNKFMLEDGVRYSFFPPVNRRDQIAKQDNLTVTNNL